MPGLYEQLFPVAEAIANSCRKPPGMDSFAKCMRDIDSSAWPELATKFSNLNPDGSPVEFVFSSHENTLRYTVEVAGPEHAEHTRIDLACMAMRRLGFDPPAGHFVDVWRDVHKQSKPKWGAWLGIRQREDGESAKVYVEVPPGSPLGFELANKHCPIRGARVVMLGYEPSRGRLEWYFRKRRMCPSELEAILRWGQSPAQHAAVIRAIEHVSGVSITAALRWFAPSFSIAQWESGRLPALFLRSSTLGGSPAIRRYLCSTRLRASTGLHFYCDLVEKLPDAELPEHGMLTFSSTAAGEVEIRLGMSGAALAHAWYMRPARASQSTARTAVLSNGLEAPAGSVQHHPQMVAGGV
jgi:hypothetical protein